MSVPEIPGYFALRLGADLATSIRGQPVWFGYGAGELQITAPGTLPAAQNPAGLLSAPDPLPAAPPVPVYTPASASGRPTVQYLTLDVPSLQASVPVPADQFGALFWSESAVEKFLLPYYASAAGPHALEVLQAICQAWYHFDADAPVCAMAFGYPSSPFQASVQLWDTIGVVVWRPAESRLVLEPLRQYIRGLRRLHVGLLPPPASFEWGPEMETDAVAGTPDIPIDSVGAREVAEYVSGLRGNTVDVYAVEVEGGLEPVLTTQGSGPPLFSAFSPFVRSGRPTATASITYLGTEDQPVTTPLLQIGGGAANVPDSAFWTDGAVEMLLVPYYASVEGNAAPWYLMLILGTWSGAIPPYIEDAAALLSQVVQLFSRVLQEEEEDATSPAARRVAEEAQAVTEGMTSAATETVAGVAGVAAVADAVSGPFDSQVITLIHLPNSEWVDQTAAPSSIRAEHRLAALTPEGAFPLVPAHRRLVPRRRVRG